MLDRYVTTALFGFVAGIFFRSFANFGAPFSFFIILISVGLFCALFTMPGEWRKRAFIPLFLFTAALGMLRYDFSDRTSVTHSLDSYRGKQIILEGFVSDEPDEREKVTRLSVTVENVSVGGQKSAIGAVVLVTADSVPSYKYGDYLSISGKLNVPKNFTDETTLREVDYKSFLAKDGIYYELFKPKITLLSRGKGNPVVSALFSFKHAFIENIRRVIGEPHAALLGGLIVGAKQSLGKKLLDDFRTVGVIHIVVLSGYNITIIAYFIEWLFSRLRKNPRLILASAGMILFALMVGASATVVRATIMALLVVVAKATGRVYAVTRALLVAGFFMLLHNPKILVFDVSFQLSFLATVGLIYFSPLIEPKVKWITEKWKLREIVVATVATQIFVLPFLLYKTGLFSVVSLPVNLLILAAIPATMLSGFLAGMAGFVSTIFSLPFAWIAYAFLSYELGVVEWFARLPFVTITLASFPLWVVVMWYAGYGAVIWKLRPKNSSQSLPS